MTERDQPSLDRIVSRIVLDASLLRYFARHGRRDEAWSAIDAARGQTNIPEELKVLDLLDEITTNGARKRQP